MAYRLAQKKKKKSHSAFSRKAGYIGWMQRQISFPYIPDNPDPETNISQTHRFAKGPSTQPNHNPAEHLKSWYLGAEIAKQKKKIHLCSVKRKKQQLKHIPSGLSVLDHLVSYASSNSSPPGCILYKHENRVLNGLFSPF